MGPPKTGVRWGPRPIINLTRALERGFAGGYADVQGRAPILAGLGDGHVRLPEARQVNALGLRGVVTGRVHAARVLRV